MLTLDELRAVIRYEPETGTFHWIKPAGKWGTIPAGSLAGCLRPDGYWTVIVFGKHYLGHRLAFFYMTGRWPDPECDHEDLDKSNNRWSNLREASKSQNKANVPIPCTNTSGIKGVSWHKKARSGERPLSWIKRQSIWAHSTA